MINNINNTNNLSGCYISASLRNYNLKPSEIAIWCILLSYQGNDRGCSPSIKTLTSDLSMSERTTQRALKALESLGLINIERTQGEKNKYIAIPLI